MTAHTSALPPHVAIDGSKLYATQGSIYTFDAQHGTLLQSYPIKGVRASVVIDEVLYTNAINTTNGWNYSQQMPSQAVQAFHTRDGSQLWSYPALRLTEIPVVVNGIVYASDMGKGCVYAILAHTGTLLWSYQIGKPLHTCPFPVIAGGIAYLTPALTPPHQSYVYALRARHGSQLWRIPIPEASHVPPIVHEGIVYICTDRRCSALRGWDGSLLWQYEYAPEGATPGHPVEKDGILYVGGNILANPVLQDGILYLCLHGVGYEQGKPSTLEDFPQRLRHTLYLCALDTHSGKQLWQHPLDIKPSSPPAHASEILSPGHTGRLYLSGNDGSLYAFSTDNGSTLWRYQTGATTLSPTSLTDHIVYVGASDGYIYALDADNGSLLWKSFVSIEATTPPTPPNFRQFQRNYP